MPKVARVAQLYLAIFCDVVHMRRFTLPQPEDSLVLEQKIKCNRALIILSLISGGWDTIANLT